MESVEVAFLLDVGRWAEDGPQQSSRLTSSLQVGERRRQIRLTGAPQTDQEGIGADTDLQEVAFPSRIGYLFDVAIASGGPVLYGTEDPQGSGVRLIAGHVVELPSLSGPQKDEVPAKGPRAKNQERPPRRRYQEAQGRRASTVIFDAAQWTHQLFPHMVGAIHNCSRRSGIGIPRPSKEAQAANQGSDRFVNFWEDALPRAIRWSPAGSAGHH